MSFGNQKVVRVTCQWQCVGISPCISGTADCQLAVRAGRPVDDAGTLATLRRISTRGARPTHKLSSFGFFH